MKEKGERESEIQRREGEEVVKGYPEEGGFLSYLEKEANGQTLSVVNRGSCRWKVGNYLLVQCLQRSYIKQVDDALTLGLLVIVCTNY